MELRKLSTHLQSLCHDGFSHNKVMCRLGDVELPITDIKIEKLSEDKTIIIMEIEE